MFLSPLLSKYDKYEPHHDKTNKMVCAPNEDSDQPSLGAQAILLVLSWGCPYSSHVTKLITIFLTVKRGFLSPYELLLEFAS